MSEGMNLQDPVFKLIVRFSNGEVASYVATEPIDPHAMNPEIRFGVITSVSVQNPRECVEVAVINMRDVTFIKTERVTLEHLAAEHRMAGIRSLGRGDADDRLPKLVSQLKFV